MKPIYFIVFVLFCSIAFAENACAPVVNAACEPAVVAECVEACAPVCSSIVTEQIIVKERPRIFNRRREVTIKRDACLPRVTRSRVITIAK